MKKFLLLILFLISPIYVFSIQQNSIGSQAFGMGGTGVTVKDSTWDIFYNPALLSMDKHFKFGLTFDLGLNNRNFNSMFNAIKNKNTNQINTILSDNNISITNNTGLNISFNGPLGGVGIGALLTISGNGNIIKGKANDITISYDTSALFEVPIGYSYDFEINDKNELSLGIAVKYMNLSVNKSSSVFNDNTNMSDVIRDFMTFSTKNNDSNIGVDFGIIYELDDIWNIGLVAKNINAPKFNINNNTYTLHQQLKAGTSVNYKFFTIALDVDILKNDKSIFNTNVKTQYVNLGTMFNFKFVSLRGGLMYDFINKDEVIYTAGLGIGFLDLGVQVSSKTTQIDKYKIPDNIALNIGINFSF